MGLDGSWVPLPYSLLCPNSVGRDHGRVLSAVVYCPRSPPCVSPLGLVLGASGEGCYGIHWRLLANQLHASFAVCANPPCLCQQAARFVLAWVAASGPISSQFPPLRGLPTIPGPSRVSTLVCNRSKSLWCAYPRSISVGWMSLRPNIMQQ